MRCWLQLQLIPMRCLRISASAARIRATRACSTAPLVPTPCTMLTEEEKMLVESVREFALKRIKPKVLEMDEAQTMCPVLIKQCFDQGLMGIETPEKYGGSGMSFFSSILAIEELARIDASISGVVDVQNTLLNNVFFRYGSDAQRAAYLPRLSKDTVGSFCLTETGSGSDAFALKTRAVQKGDDWVINGSKVFITNAAEAEIFLVMATVDPSMGYKGITCFVVDTTVTNGLKLGRRENKMGTRASATMEVIFEDVVVPKANVVGEVSKGYKIAIEMLNEGRIGVGAQLLGVAQGSLDASMPYLFERKQFNTAIGDFQGMQFQYAQAALDIHAARLLVYNAARKKCHGEPFVEDAAMAKLYASQVAERVASKSIEWMGGVGFMKEYGVEKFYRDAKIGSIYEGTTNIQHATIAKFVKERYAPKK
jgi:alkylation response protein AidB-like acyl-CoA dehydrogenase